MTNKQLHDHDLFIVIINWNTKDLLRQCLDSISSALKKNSYQVIVVDNASTDNSVEMLRNGYPNVIIIENKKNIGFARANNQAFKLIEKGDFVLMLNSDTLLIKDTLQKMIDFMKKNPEAGVSAPALRFPDGKFQSGGGFSPTLITDTNYFLFLSIVFPLTFKGLFINQRKRRKMAVPFEVDWVAGTCMLIRKKVIDQTGGLDESYFMYAEDAEWCERIKRLGWKIYFLPHLEIIHFHGASSKTISNQWIKSFVSYVRDKKGFTQSIMFRMIMAAGFALRTIFYFAGYIITHKKDWLKKTSQMCIYFTGTFG